MKIVAVRRVSIPIDGARALRRTVLLVTGDDDLRAAAARALAASDYDVIEAPHSGHALLRCLDASRVDVLVTELAMDDSSGLALARLLRRHHPDMLTLFFAQPGTPESEGVLVRPFTRDELLAQVEGLVAAHR